jgi:mono/diheme cytochrome c family protein
MRHSVRWSLAVTVIGLACSLLVPAAVGRADDTPAQAQQRALLRKGAQLWPVVCASCHNARGAAERSPAEWDTIVQHMRVRANIPGEEAQAILDYLRRR